MDAVNMGNVQENALSEPKINTEKQAQQPQTSLFHDIMDMIETAIFAVFIVGMIFTFLFRQAVVEGDSMRMTLIDGERLIISNLFYKPERLDIVVIDNTFGHIFSDEEETEVVENVGLNLDGSVKYIVKRVIATAGQKLDIDFKTGTVYVDDKALVEEYVNGDWHNNEGAFDYPIVIPEGYIFVMGDNRSRSSDSRNPKIGLVKTEDVIGKVVFRILPFSKFGTID
jgi:signal peptidase I